MEKTVEYVAELMEIAAITAPKALGKNYIVTRVIKGEDLRNLGKRMVSYGEEKGKKNFDRDGKNVLDSQAVLLVGMKDAKAVGLNCGACGFPQCITPNTATEPGEFAGPQCPIRVLDMGIALGSAAKTASMLNVDNRIMYRIGVVAREMRLMDADFIMGIPLSVSGKSIYFDR
ncbi:MAG: hypothetical protein JW760_12865 [Spirochaetales bacterium]|nr:hypothetical protein [Spirochaetales bacterium]